MAKATATNEHHLANKAAWERQRRPTDTNHHRASQICKQEVAGSIPAGSTAVAMRKINLTLDEDLVSRARRQDLGEADKSDDQVVEDALAVFLGLRALDEARAQGTLAGEDADQLVVEEVRAVRRARSRA
jgi:hypothetical protein